LIGTACAIALVSLSACDRQNGGNPQATADNRGNAASSAGQVTAPPGARFAIDRSKAGTPLPADVIIAPDDSRAALTSISGKPTLVNLWATWCAPCVEELPTLDGLSTRVGDGGQIVLVSQDLGDDPAGPRQFLRDGGWGRLSTWHDPENSIGLMVQAPLPTTILYNREGKEVVRVIGPLDWQGDLARALLTEAGFPA
jgi:thiol-disulfide isomerase/thioredoxin